jgi:prepilin-type processing-associated H-X9-DG protein
VCSSDLPTNWSYAIGLNDGRPDGYRVLGFAFLWACSWNYQGTMRIRGGLKETDPADPTKKWVTRTDMPQASTVEMVVDTVMSERQDTTKAYDLTKYPDGNFAQIFSGGNDELYGTPDQTSHLVSDKKAAGGNIGFVDGHVEWRNFKDMRNRIGPGGVGPMWWW